MNHTYHESELILSPNGRLDVSCADALSQEVTQLVKERPARLLTVDASGLTEVLPGGMRLLLAWSKLAEDYRIVNVPSGVYEMLETAGLTEFLDIRRAYRQISVEGCRIINRGGHGTTYQLDSDTIVKVYDKGDTLESIQRERDYARRAFTHGIATAIPLDIVQCGAYYGFAMEMIHAENLSAAISHHPENIPEYAKKYASVLKKLHHTELEPGVLSPIKPIYHEKVEKMSRLLTAEETAKLHWLIDWIPERNTICHGDYHEKNIMLRDGELILIDMAKFTTGHPIFDLSVMYTSNVLVGQSHPELALKHMGMPYESALKMWELFLRAYFDGADEEQLCSYNQLISGFAEYQAMTSRGSDSNFPESMVPMLLEQVRGKLLPLIDQMTGRPLPF